MLNFLTVHFGFTSTKLKYNWKWNRWHNRRNAYFHLLSDHRRLCSTHETISSRPQTAKEQHLKKKDSIKWIIKVIAIGSYCARCSMFAGRSKLFAVILRRCEETCCIWKTSINQNKLTVTNLARPSFCHLNQFWNQLDKSQWSLNPRRNMEKSG